MIVVDANLLIYAVNRDSPDHESARFWWEATLSGTDAVGIPWVVALGFVRITTRRGILTSPLTIQEATDYVSEWLAQPYVKLLVPTSRHWALFQAMLLRTGSSGNLTTDAHIATLALESGATVYSSDYDFRRFYEISHINPLESAK